MLVGWVVRVPLLAGKEGHEAITRAAWEGLALTVTQRRALIRGVRAPDIGLAGLLSSAFPFAQQRHALRAWYGTTTADAIQQMRDFMTARHLRALALPDGPRRWAVFGEVLHCLQDSYSPAHADRDGARILMIRHWGPLDALRRTGGGTPPVDEHGFPTDRRDRAWTSGALSAEAGAAVSASRGYLAVAARHSGSAESEESRRRELSAFLDGCVSGATDNDPNRAAA